MDPQLKTAAKHGDIEFLKQAVASHDDDAYFLSLDEWKDNIFHLAEDADKMEWIREAMKILPTHILLQLLSQPTSRYQDNTLHIAAENSWVELVVDIIGFYKLNSLDKPWLALNGDKRTPLHTAIAYIGKEESAAMEILSTDMEVLVQMVDSDGNSPLFLAVRHGCNEVAEKILNSNCSYSLSGEYGSTPLHVAPNSSVNVTKLLLQKHPECLDIIDDRHGYNMLHQWGLKGGIKELKLVLNGEFPTAKSKVLHNLIFMQDKVYGDTPLHIAIRYKKFDFVQKLVDAYQKEGRKGEGIAAMDDHHPPWKAQNKNGDTPLHLALSLRSDKFALYFLSLDSTVCQIRNNKGETPLFVAIHKECQVVVEKILEIHEYFPKSMLQRTDGVVVLPLSCSEKTTKLLVEKYPDCLDIIDHNGFNMLHLWTRQTNLSKIQFILKGDFPAAKSKVFRDFIHMREEENGDTLLHIALRFKDFDFVQLLIHAYQQVKTIEAHDDPLWKAQNKDGD